MLLKLPIAGWTTFPGHIVFGNDGFISDDFLLPQSL